MTEFYTNKMFLPTHIPITPEHPLSPFAEFYCDEYKERGVIHHRNRIEDIVYWNIFEGKGIQIVTIPDKEHPKVRLVVHDDQGNIMYKGIHVKKPITIFRFTEPDAHLLEFAEDIRTTVDQFYAEQKSLICKNKRVRKDYRECKVEIMVNNS